VPHRLPTTPPPEKGPSIRRVWAGLAAIAVAFVAGGIVAWPLGVVAVIGFVLLLALEASAARRLRRLPLEGVSWPILLYVSGMVVLVSALQRQGVIEGVVGAALSAVRDSPQLTGIVASLMAAIGSNLVNNVPMTLVMVGAINDAHLSGAAREAAAYGTIVGADLGPNLTPIGSLATVLWLLILRERGLEVRPIDYLRFGLLTTPPILLVATLLVALPR
jgi:arsenical pump membrane protein